MSVTTSLRRLARSCRERLLTDHSSGGLSALSTCFMLFKGLVLRDAWVAEGLCCGLGKCRRNRHKRERRSRWLEFETRESIQGANTHPNKQCHNNGPHCYRSARRTRSHSFIFRLSPSEAIRRSRDTPSYTARSAPKILLPCNSRLALQHFTHAAINAQTSRSGSRNCLVCPAPLCSSSAIPIDRVQRMKQIVDTMHGRSMQIMEEKKRAVRRGDNALLEQIGEGKDVMSILCMY